MFSLREKFRIYISIHFSEDFVYNKHHLNVKYLVKFLGFRIFLFGNMSTTNSIDATEIGLTSIIHLLKRELW